MKYISFKQWACFTVEKLEQQILWCQESQPRLVLPVFYRSFSWCVVNPFYDKEAENGVAGHRPQSTRGFWPRLLTQTVSLPFPVGFLERHHKAWPSGLHNRCWILPSWRPGTCPRPLSKLREACRPSVAFLDFGCILRTSAFLLCYPSLNHMLCALLFSTCFGIVGRSFHLKILHYFMLIHSLACFNLYHNLSTILTYFSVH